MEAPAFGPALFVGAQLGETRKTFDIETRFENC
jgi:hypothetical protein